MRFLRSMFGWLLVGLGVFSFAVWAAAKLVVDSVEDGSVVSGLASTVLHRSHVQTIITDQAQTLVVNELSANGVNVSGTPDEQLLHDAIAATVRSEGFIDDLVALVQQVESDVIAQLTDERLPLAPLVVTLDIGEPLLNAMQATPGLKSLVPTTAIAPITITAVEEDEVSRARSGYNGVEWLASWGLWIALGLLLLGLVIVPRKRWIIPKFLLGSGLFALGAFFLARWIVVEEFVTHLPGGAEGRAGSMLSNLMPQESVDRIQSGLLKLAILLLVLAALAYTLVFVVSRRKDGERERKRQDRAEADAPPTTTAPVATGSSASGVRVEGDTVVFGTPEEQAEERPEPRG